MRVIIALLFCCVASGQVVDRFTRFESGFLDYPNASNPNPELMVNDAVSLDPAENVNAINDVDEVASGATVAAVASDSGYTLYAREVTASSDGTLKRDRIDLDGVLIDGEVYSLDVLHKCSDATNNVRDRIAAGGTLDNQHAAHTDWQLHSYEFTASGTNFEYNQYVRTTSVTGQTTTYNFSLKQKND